ncbi:transporter substrate-binding domain-containing protein [Mesorhizobium amorphae]|uniref:ABC transporter periplasmic subunit family 3 n=1 Tax=Mesorhizobium amorphae CCNWGS0123 TaxID=1082933 RepID=G6Y486_9HYPH|nr:transporter substrate-binding domain-containing protein [Mesorhizobium amorphae]ANT54879.1 hypothetical protein A6B35_33555 [Mesorhizobium amorphae CCNWGS0123]EHH13443.1 ABC transporter periplasmic subunit family 3 [Mesorhizobium amorphae CCNWGS0123]
MTIWRKRLQAAAILLGCIIAGTPVSAQQQKYVVGMDAAYPPFVSVNSDGQMIGFEIDFMNALCAEIKIQCEIQNVPYDGIFAALEAGKIDVIAGGNNITDERKQKYLMPGPYLRGPLAFIVPVSSTIDGSKESLKGKTVGTVGGSVQEKYMREQIGRETTVKLYDSMDAAVLDLDAGRVDAVLSEELQALPGYIQAKPDTYKLAGKSIYDPAYMGQGKGLMVRKTDASLAENLQKGIDAMIANGKLAEFSKKWFGKAVPAR